MTADISIIIPTYQRPELLLRCLIALKRQNFSRDNYEVIVVTDGADATTRHVVNHYRNELGMQLFCWSLPEKKGPAAARNYGWKHAKGRLIIFVDDDCIPEKNMIASYWNAFEYSGEECVVFTGKVVVPLPEHPTDYELNVSHLETCEFVTANCACAKKCLEKVGGFDEAFEMAWREDSDLQFRFIDLQIPIQKVNEAQVIHPARKTSWGASLKEQRKSMYEALLYKKHPGHYRSRIFKHPKWNYYWIIFSAISTLIGLFVNTAFSFVFGLVCLVLILHFIFKRLRHTSHSPAHICEMIVTSFCIPFLSVYWTVHGAIRYRTWFL
jgi:glycosyltransferase involved in cell wall biosynthesis